MQRLFLCALYALVLLILCGLWVQRAEVIVLACQITESVPPVPGVAVLLLLAGLSGILHQRFPKIIPNRAETLALYFFISIAISLAGCGVIRYFFSNLTAGFYYATPENGFQRFHPFIPSWLAPRDPKTLRYFYEGSPDGSVPWSHWVVPLVAWGLLYLFLWITLLGLILLFERIWSEQERLTFPLVDLPLRVTEGVRGWGMPTFFRDPLMWIGFGLAGFYNGINILHCFIPAVPSIGKFFDLGVGLTNPPWDAGRPLIFWIRPELVGFGYLVSLEVSFSAWFFYLLQRLVAVIGRGRSLELPGFPFPQEQSFGGYLVMAGFLLWSLRRAYANTKGTSSALSMNALLRKGFWGSPALMAGLGFVGVVVWCRWAGMDLWVSVLYFGVVGAVALVYARIRAEVGVPLIWMFPFYQQKRMLIKIFGTEAFTGGGNFSNLVLLSLLVIFSRGYFPSLAAYSIEGLQMGRVLRSQSLTGDGASKGGILSRKALLRLSVVALPVGLVLAWYIHLAAYYRYGAAPLQIWGGTWLAIPEYTELVGFLQTPRPPHIPSITAASVGGIVTLTLVLLRRSIVGFPFHPVGYLMSTSYGELVWGPFFAVWVLKLLILRYGGMKLYRRMIPAFLGFALGHFFVAGVIWGLVGMYYPEALQGYQVWFG